MILPRPIPPSENGLVDYISSRFTPGQKFELCDKYHIYKYNKCDAKGVHCFYGVRNYDIGLLRFYKLVKTDIGEIYTYPPGTMPPMIWLLSGTDGLTNGDRLCKAWALNQGLIPRLGTPHGEALRLIISESNHWIANSVETNVNEVYEYLDNNLVKYNTYLDDLANMSGVKLKGNE